MLDETPQLGVGQELIGGHDCAVSGVASVNGTIGVSDDRFANHRLDAVGTDDEVAVEGLAGAEGDRGRIGVNGGDEAVEAEVDEGDGDIV